VLQLKELRRNNFRHGDRTLESDSGPEWCPCPAGASGMQDARGRQDAGSILKTRTMIAQE